MGADARGDGRFLAASSVDEYAATFARWFGVAETDLPLIAPNLHRFSQHNIAFL